MKVLQESTESEMQQEQQAHKAGAQQQEAEKPILNISGHRGLVVGTYVLDELLGIGGMGEVWKATHQQLGRQVAIKLIRSGISASGLQVIDEKALRRFSKEAKAMSQLSSANTVQVYDFGTTDDGIFYYAMELLPGMSLQALIDSFGPMSVERTLHVLLQVCDSLAEAHEKGLVHRDIKPANIYVGKAGVRQDVVKVLDFGLVKNLSSEQQTQLTQLGAIPGSPAYLSPESIKSTEELTEKTDIYSLGCVAYWMLTGKLVFEGSTPLEMIIGHAERTPIPPAQHNKEVPSELEDLILQCLEKDPAKRPADISEISLRLQQIAHHYSWSSEDAIKWWLDHAQDVSSAHRSYQFSDMVLEPEQPKSYTALSPQQRKALISSGLNALQHHFTRSHIDIFELEKRMAAIRKAQSQDEVKQQLSDLPAIDEQHMQDNQSETKASSKTYKDTREELAVEKTISNIKQTVMHKIENQIATSINEEQQVLVSVFSENHRLGTFDKKIKSVAVFGGAVIDYSNQALPDDTIEIVCTSVFGSNVVVVPKDAFVEVAGIGFFGEFKHTRKCKPTPPGCKPHYRIKGVSVFGGVNVTTPKESFLKKLLDP